MVRRIAVSAISALFCFGIAAAQNEQIVYIDGVKYTAYTVVSGDTLYSLSKRYNISIEQINAANPILAEGLKSGQVIKIPHSAPNAKAEKRSKKQFKSHIVVKGDTFYSIARNYGISVTTLMEDNRDIDPSHISIGQTLYIRRSEMGLSTEVEVREQIEEHKQVLNSVVAADEYSYHVVHKGEDISNIASRFKTTAEQILKLNGFASNDSVREGLIIKIPKVTVESEPQIAVADTIPQQQEVSVAFRAIKPTERAEVALMLPISVNGRASQNYLDFYQGFLLAADHLRLEGYQSHIHLYNTAHNHKVITDIIENNELENTNLIVGPVYEDLLIPIANYAEQHSIPVVSPLANLTQSQNSNIFQMSPNPQAKFEKVQQLFDGSQRVVVITSETIDADFEAEVKQMLGETPYTTHHYIYEHPSVIEKREKEREEGEEAVPSPSDLSPLLAEQPQSVFVIMAGSEVETDRILAALASANISLRARSISAAPYVVFGNNKWNRYKNIDRSLFFTNNVIMVSTYHIDRTNPIVSIFNKQYIKAFGSVPSLYAYRGYDAAMVFIRSLYDKIEQSLEGSRFQPLQTPYNFTPIENGVRTNSEWVRVNYHKNFTITAE